MAPLRHIHNCPHVHASRGAIDGCATDTELLGNLRWPHASALSRRTCAGSIDAGRPLYRDGRAFDVFTYPRSRHAEWHIDCCPLMTGDFIGPVRDRHRRDPVFRTRRCIFSGMLPQRAATTLGIALVPAVDNGNKSHSMGRFLRWRPAPVGRAIGKTDGPASPPTGAVFSFRSRRGAANKAAFQRAASIGLVEAEVLNSSTRVLPVICRRHPSIDRDRSQGPAGSFRSSTLSPRWTRRELFFLRQKR